MTKTSNYPLVYFIIAVGGYLKKPDVTRLEITKEEIEEFCSDEGGSKEDAINYFLEEELGAWEQHFCKAIALSEKEFNLIRNMTFELIESKKFTP